jgi:hypothetical protein
MEAANDLDPFQGVDAGHNGGVALVGSEDDAIAGEQVVGRDHQGVLLLTEDDVCLQLGTVSQVGWQGGRSWLRR